LDDIHLCHCSVDHLLHWISRQHHGVGGAAMAPKSITGQHSAVRWVSGSLRHWSDVQLRLGRSL